MQADKDVTIYDIGKKLKTSLASVSRGLKDDPSIGRKTKKKILETAEELGYLINHFARNLRSQKTMTIWVIVSRLNSNFMSPAIAGIENVVKIERLHEATCCQYSSTIALPSEFMARASSLKKK